MIDVVLAAGYATRMYPLTENFPKPLLEIKGKAILDHLLEDIDAIDDVTAHVVVTNHKFIGFFREWKKNSRLKKPITIIDDGSVDNEHRLGAVKDLILAIGDDVQNDYLVVAADNLLDFSLKGFVDFFDIRFAEYGQGAVSQFFIHKIHRCFFIHTGHPRSDCFFDSLISNCPMLL